MTAQKKMNDQEDEQTKMMIFALQKFKTSGKKFISSSQLKKNMKQKNKERKIVRKKRNKPASIYKEAPTLDELKKIDPDVEWEQKDLLFEAGMISIVEKIINALQSQRAPSELIRELNDLKTAMINLDSETTKEKLFTLTEQWGSTNANDEGSYHLLRAFIGIMFATYPLE